MEIHLRQHPHPIRVALTLDPNMLMKHCPTLDSTSGLPTSGVLE